MSVTPRQVASLIGLCTFMAHTLDISLRDHFNLLRVYSRLAHSVRADRDWDSPLHITPDIVSAIGAIAGPLIANLPHVPSAPTLRGDDIYNEDRYDAVAIIDACSTGIGALIRFRSGETWRGRKGWANHIPHSAWAEPKGGQEVATFLRRQGACSLAIVTDHAAMAFGQQRSGSGNGGFSHAFYLNEAFRAFYGGGPCEVFYVVGAANPADAASRATQVGDTVWHWQKVENEVFPSLSTFFHPFEKSVTIPWWNV